MINIKKKEITKIIPIVKLALEKYLWIQKEYLKRNTSRDNEFQRKFNSYYRITPRRDKEWQKIFYSLLEKSKKGKTSFESILEILYKKTGRIEASFASKLVATINPAKPVIDSVVLKNIGWRLPYTYKKDRKLEINKIYQNLVKEFLSFLKTEDGKYLVEQFIKKYPKARITKVKMLDLILWQTRD